MLPIASPTTLNRKCCSWEAGKKEEADGQKEGSKAQGDGGSREPGREPVGGRTGGLLFSENPDPLGSPHTRVCRVDLAVPSLFLKLNFLPRED